MGIIILPFLFVAFCISVYALIKTILLLNSKRITLKEIGRGLILSLILLLLISLSYIIEGRAWVLSPSFRLPIFIVFVPFIIYLSTVFSENNKIKYVSNIVLISLCWTGILGVIFNDFFLGLVNHLNIEVYH